MGTCDLKFKTNIKIDKEWQACDGFDVQSYAIISWENLYHNYKLNKSNVERKIRYY